MTTLKFRLEYPQTIPAGRWGWLMHDYELGDYWGEKKGGRNRSYPQKLGKPETVVTFEKDDTTKLSTAWQAFYMQFWCLVAFGTTDLSRFSEIRGAFNSAMASNRVITNFSDWINGYMTLGMGGNIVKILGEGRPNAKFGESYIVETLNASEPPPGVIEVYNKPWLWSKATICRYDETMDNPWANVIPFPQLEPWNAPTPLMLISKHGKANIQKERVKLLDEYKVPNPYNPPR